MKKFCYSFLFALLFASCQSHYVKVSKVNIDQTTLASTFVRSPDPRQSEPPSGEKLYITWRLPLSSDPKEYHLVLSVIYKDLSEEKKTYPLPHRIGFASFPLLDDKFKETKGFYAYQVELIDKNDKIVDTWQHQMWVKVLH